MNVCVSARKLNTLDRRNVSARAHSKTQHIALSVIVMGLLVNNVQLFHIFIVINTVLVFKFTEKLTTVRQNKQCLPNS